MGENGVSNCPNRKFFPEFFQKNKQKEAPSSPSLPGQVPLSGGIKGKLFREGV